jgi:hypothetical protein
LAVYQEHHGSQPGAAENLHLVRDFPTTSIIIAKKIQRKSSGIRFAFLHLELQNLLLEGFAGKEEHSS